MLWDRFVPPLMIGCTAGVNGRKGLVPRPLAGEHLSFLRGDGTWQTISGAGVGDMSGPTGATDNAIARFNGAGGKNVQNSGVIIDDSNNVTGINNLTVAGTTDRTTGSATGAFIVSGGSSIAKGLNVGLSSSDTYPLGVWGAGGTDLVAMGGGAFAKVQGFTAAFAASTLQLNPLGGAITTGSGAFTVGGNLTVSGTGGSSVAGNWTIGAGSGTRALVVNGEGTTSGQGANIQLAANSSVFAYLGRASYTSSGSVNTNDMGYWAASGLGHYFWTNNGTLALTLSSAGNTTVGGNLTVGGSQTISNGMLTINHATNGAGILMKNNGTDAGIVSLGTYIGGGVPATTVAMYSYAGDIRLFAAAALAALFTSTATTLAGNLAVQGTGTSTFTGSCTFGAGTADTQIVVNGGTSGAAGGGSVNARNGGTTIVAIGGQSAIIGGGYSAVPMFYFTGASLRLYSATAGADAMTLSSAGNATLAGSITTSAPTGGAGAWKLGIANAVSPTSPNRTITIEIGGTVYYLHAKTTNN